MSIRLNRILGVLMVACALFTGCAKAGVDVSENRCTFNTDCPDRYLCNPVTRLCYKPKNMDMTSDTSPDLRADMTSDQSTDMSDMSEDVAPDLDPNACMPACGMNEECVNGSCMPIVRMCDPPCTINEECKNGTCVPKDTGTCNPECPETEVCKNGSCVPAVCDPTCPAPGVCTRSGCSYPTCASAGGACDSSMFDQGNFWCLISRKTNRSSCFAKCTDPLSPSTCGDAEYCLSINNNNASSYCLPSECNVDSDCNNGADRGSCIRWDNNFGYCEPSGNVQPGGTCDASNPALRCVQGSTCTNSGVCRKLCDMWASPSQCGAGERCNIYSTRSGICVNNPDATGAAPYSFCTTPGNYCSDGVRCIAGSRDNYCFKYCRVETDGTGFDCGSLSGAVCNNYISPSNRSLGQCVPTCDNDNLCGTGGRCIDTKCRRTCTAATVSQDCCGGQSPCDWTCNNGLCE